MAALLVATAAFGRPFSKLHLPPGIYVTEIALAAAVALAVRRLGVRECIDRVRSFVPLLPLAVLALGGAVATVRGIAAYGPGAVIQDIGLAAYAAVLPLVAVVAGRPRPALTLARALYLASFASLIVYAIVFFAFRFSALGIVENPGAAVGFYLSVVPLWAVASFAYGRTPRLLELAGAAAALVLMLITSSRSVALGLTAALVTIVVVSVGRRGRAAAAATAAAVIAVGGTVVVQGLGVGVLPPPVAAPPVAVDASGFAASDRLDEFVGGTVGTGGADGRYSRVIDRRALPYIDLPALGGLVAGGEYTVTFFAQPLQPLATSGVVGDTAGTGWGVAAWTTEASRRWQRIRATLRATGPVERLAIFVNDGPDRIRIDGVSVRSRDSLSAEPPSTPTGTTFVGTAKASFDPASPSGDYANMRWRLSYWKALVVEAAHSPIFGVGFGRPADFTWNGVSYDRRQGDSTDPFDVAPPHNSFVNMIFRMGGVSLFALLALVAVAAVRAIRFIRTQPTGTGASAILTVLLAALAFASVVAFFNVALENPYLGLFFWTILALLLVIPSASGGERADTGARPVPGRSSTPA